MSYANGTPFLNLPQTVGTDKRDWFDCNEAFLDLDGKVKAAYEGEIDTAAALSALTEVVSGISTDVESLQGTVGEHTTSIGTINEALTLINSALVSLNTSVSGKFDSAGIADPYDAEHGTYSVGDVVTYNGQRYECVTAVTAAEPFDADKWNAVDIQTKLDQINTSLVQSMTWKDANINGTGDTTNDIVNIGIIPSANEVIIAVGGADNFIDIVIRPFDIPASGNQSRRLGYYYDSANHAYVDCAFDNNRNVSIFNYTHVEAGVTTHTFDYHVFYR